MVKLPTAKYWFALGYLDGYEGKESAFFFISMPEIYVPFYERGHKRGKAFTRRNGLLKVAKRLTAA